MMNTFFLMISLSQGMMTAQSLEEFYLTKVKNFHTSYEIQLCQKQLERNKIPHSCYKIHSLKKNQKFQTYIDEKCQDLTLEKISLKNVSLALKNSDISSFCRKILREKEKILQHQWRDSPSQNGLREFFQK